MTRSFLPYSTAQAKETVDCYPSHIQPLLKAFEKLQVSSFNFLQATTASRNKKTKLRGDKANSPPYDTLLKSQKQALSSCAALLGCSECSLQSELVMLVVSQSTGDIRTTNSAESRHYTGYENGEGFIQQHQDAQGDHMKIWDGAKAIMMDEHDEEDTAQIIRTLTASRIAKLRGILGMVVKAARGAEQRPVEQGLAAADWASYVGLATLLQGKLRRYS
ncbi:hypothetical protein QBC37DRAFT_459775 [Rhypophila decipiens]|uniref:Uncharacterized protein n=1 Tax=Rhypophila decipiens TaxID=261697 RepID=A0AAN6XVH9_9PEZI|nr:hypothetical protein QBC37DRAFT_459775 [Rhypophila decipiens]